jgi:Amidase
MTESPLWMLPATEQAAGIRRGDWSAEQLTEAVLNRIDDANPQLNAYCTLDDRTLDAAREADATLRRGERPGPLHGVPFSVKDLIPTKGVRTTLGSLAHRDWIPDTDEISAARMRAAGAILVGKTKTRERGYGVVADNEIFGPTRNPWDPRMTAAGSSSGAAAAVAAGMGTIALGSDGGGSLRVPAVICGAFSVKPTFGVVPLYPSCRVPLRTGLDSWESLECIGPITRTVADSALVLSAISGFDARDRRAAPLKPLPVTRPDASRAHGLTVAFSADMGIAEVDPEIADLGRPAGRARRTAAVRRGRRSADHARHSDHGVSRRTPLPGERPERHRRRPAVVAVRLPGEPHRPTGREHPRRPHPLRAPRRAPGDRSPLRRCRPARRRTGVRSGQSLGRLLPLAATGSWWRARIGGAQPGGCPARPSAVSLRRAVRNRRW